MANLNKVMLIGNLTRDPEMRYLPSGTPVCELGMAINRTWTDQSGEKKEQTCFVDMSAFARQAETLHKYMRKGRPLFVEGRLDFSSWETPEGQKRSKLKVIIENFQFLGGRDDRPADNRGPAMAAQGAGGGGSGGGYGNANGGGGGGGYSAPPRQDVVVDDDDIPF